MATPPAAPTSSSRTATTAIVAVSGKLPRGFHAADRHDDLSYGAHKRHHPAEKKEGEMATGGVVSRLPFPAAAAVAVRAEQRAVMMTTAK